MEDGDATALLARLDDSIDDLEEAVQHLTKAPLAEQLQKLPLLDRSKLCVLMVYAIGSILFSYLRLHGTDAKKHPVFRELSRVKEYFAKIQNAEQNSKAPTLPTTRVDQGAAGRMIKHALAGQHQAESSAISGQDVAGTRPGAKRKAETGRETRPKQSRKSK